jgi:threonine/homoserine efflux transporter RhtA
MTARWRVAIAIGFVVGAVTGWSSESKYTDDPTGILAYAILNGLFWAVFVLVIWGRAYSRRTRARELPVLHDV